MNTQRLKTVALSVVLTLFATMAATAQTVNMSRYITLTVTQGQQIRLNLKAAAEGTPVKIVSGSNEQTITVGTSGTGYQNYTAGATTMTVYGDITGFRCSDNGTKLTALNVSHNTALTELNCRSNNFTTQAFNDLMCSLPARTTADGARFYPLYDASDAGATAFMATNSQIATAKNWQVRYGGGSGAIPATTGTYTCPVVNMSRYITLTVRQGQQIRLDLIAAAAGTKVKVVSGSTNQTITVGTSWTGFQNYTAGATTMTVYGDITEFDCSGNGTKLTALDVSHNTALTVLNCRSNNFTTQAFNDLMCSLPARTTADGARFYPLYDASDAGATAFMATNSQIATAKNWQVRYGGGSGAIPATTGTYTCPVIGIAEVASVPLSVYPNPATDILTVETEATGSVITLTDLTGRTVMTATATDGKTTLNIAHLAAGTYIVRVGDRVGKVVKR